MGKQSNATRGDRFVAQTVRTAVGRSRSVGARRDGASTRATPHATTRDRDRDANLDAREPRRARDDPSVGRESRRARASRGSARDARDAWIPRPRATRADDARDDARRRGDERRGRGIARRRRGIARGVGFARRARATRGPGDDGRARACVRVHISTSRDSSQKGLAIRRGFGADSVPIRGRWRCDGWSPCRSSAKRARA